MSNYILIPIATTVDSGTATATAADQLVEAGQDFETTVSVGDMVWNTTDDTTAYVTNVVDDTTLDLSADIMANTETYVILSTVLSDSNQIVNAGLIGTVVPNASTIETVISMATPANDTITIDHAPNPHAGDLIANAILAPTNNTRPYQPYASVEAGSTGLLVSAITVT